MKIKDLLYKIIYENFIYVIMHGKDSENILGVLEECEAFKSCKKSIENIDTNYCIFINCIDSEIRYAEQRSVFFIKEKIDERVNPESLKIIINDYTKKGYKVKLKKESYRDVKNKKQKQKFLIVSWEHWIKYCKK